MQFHRRITGKHLFFSQSWSKCHILARAGFHAAGWELQPLFWKGQEQTLRSVHVFLLPGLTGLGAPKSHSRFLGSFSRKLRHHRRQWLTLLIHPVNWGHLSSQARVFSTSVQLSFVAGWFFAERGCPVHCQIFISNPDLYALDTSSNSPAVILKNVSRQSVSSRGAKLALVETHWHILIRYLSVFTLLHSYSKPSLQNPTIWTSHLLIKVAIFFTVL